MNKINKEIPKYSNYNIRDKNMELIGGISNCLNI